MRDAPPEDSPGGSGDCSLADLIHTGLLAALVMVAAVMCFYGLDIATGSKLFFTHDIAGSDIWHLNFPMKHFYKEGLAEGRLPLWCHHLGTGFPLHAEGQVGALYPLNLLLFWILPLVTAFNWSILIHAMLSGVFAAMYARQLGACRSACLVAAVVFAFSGFFVTHLKHINMTASAVWIPLILLLLERYARKRSLKILALFSVVVGAMILAGHPQIMYNNLLIAGMYAIYLLVRVWRRLPIHGGGRSSAIRFAGGCLWAVLLGMLLGMPQILPTLELNRFGPRKDYSFEEATQWQYHPKHLLAFLLPSAFGDPGELRTEPLINPQTGQPYRNRQTGETIMQLKGFEQDQKQPMLYWEMTGYVGLLPLVLFVVCLVLGFSRRNVRMLLVFLILSLLLCLGKMGGIFYFFYYLVPEFNLFRFHDRFLLYVDLIFAVAAALGITLVAGRIPENRRKVAVLGLSILVLVVGFLDLKWAIGDHNPKVETERWASEPECARFIKKREAGNNTPFRVLENDLGRVVFSNAYNRARGWKGDLTPYDPARNMIDPNLNLLFGITNMHIYYQLYPRWMMDAAGLLIMQGDPRRGQSTRIMKKMVSLFNVRYLIDPTGSLRGEYPLLAEYPGDKKLQGALLLEDPSWGSPYKIRLHENPDALPRAFLVPFARVVIDEPPRPGMPTTSQREMMQTGFDPKKVVLLIREPGEDTTPVGNPGPPIEGGVTFKEYDHHRIRLEVKAPGDCWLFLSDTYYPGWTALVDGVATPIHRADITGRAVQVPQGDHVVEFTFAPSSFRTGVVMAMVGILLLLTLAFQARMMGRFFPSAPVRMQRD